MVGPVEIPDHLRWQSRSSVNSNMSLLAHAARIDLQTVDHSWQACSYPKNIKHKDDVMLKYAPCWDNKFIDMWGRRDIYSVIVELPTLSLTLTLAISFGSLVRWIWGCPACWSMALFLFLDSHMPIMDSRLPANLCEQHGWLHKPHILTLSGDLFVNRKWSCLCKGPTSSLLSQYN